MGDEQVLAQSLLMAKPVFRIPASSVVESQGQDPEARGEMMKTMLDESILADYEGPKLTPQMPGIQTAGMPVWH
ncbi:MAG: hypothetical protein R3C20_06230 [Planctomycetaceae bacterium]